MDETSSNGRLEMQAQLVDFRRPFRVGDYRVDPERREVSRDGSCVVINPKDLEVLRELARRPGRVLAKRALIAAVWGDQIVGDHALTNAIHQLRKAFNDEARSPVVIRTVHRYGYELVAQISEAPEENSPAQSPERRPSKKSGSRRYWRIWLLAFAAVLVTLAIRLVGQDPSPAPVRLVLAEASDVVAESARLELRQLKDLASRFIEAADHLRPAELGEKPIAAFLGAVEHGELRIDISFPGSPRQRFRGALQDRGAARRALHYAIVWLDASVANDDRMVDAMSKAGALSRKAYARTLAGDFAWARFDFATAESNYDAILNDDGLDSEDPNALGRRARLYEAMLLIKMAGADLSRAEKSVIDRGVGEEYRFRLSMRMLKLAGRLADARKSLENELQVRAYDSSLQSLYAWQLHTRERNCPAAIAIYDRLLADPGSEEVRWQLTGRSVGPKLTCGELEGASKSAERLEVEVRNRLEDGEADDEGLAPVTSAWVALVRRDLDLVVEILDRMPSTAMRSWAEVYAGDLEFIRGETAAALKHYRTAAASILAVDSIRGFLRGAIARLADGQAEEARHQAENAREIAFQRVPEPEADALLTDQMLPIRGVLALASLAVGDVEAAKAEAARLEGILELRAARNGGDIKYDRYREEWAHLVAGALLAGDGEVEAAESRYRKMLEVRPYDEPHFLPFLERRAESDPVLGVVVNEMRAVLGFEPMRFGDRAELRTASR